MAGTTTALAGNSVLFTLARAGNSPSGGNGTNIAAPLDPAAPSSLATATIASWGTAPTAAATSLWQAEIPQASGAGWTDYPPQGYEITIGALSWVAMFATCSVATSVPLAVELVYTE